MAKPLNFNQEANQQFQETLRVLIKYLRPVDNTKEAIAEAYIAGVAAMACEIIKLGTEGQFTESFQDFIDRAASGQSTFSNTNH